MAGEQYADLDGGPLEVQPSLFAHIEKGLKRNPQALATISMHQHADHLSELVADQANGRSDEACLKWTYAQIHHAALKFSVALIARGVKPGMRIATLFPNRVEWPLTLWMTTIMRLTLCSLDPGMLTPPRREELANLMQAIQPDVLVVLDSDAARATDYVFARDVPTNVPWPQVKIMLQSGGGYSSADDWFLFSKMVSTATLSRQNEDQLLQAARNDDPNRHALIVFTSGTSSGKPKGCPRDIGSTCHVLNSQVYGVRGFNENSRVLQSSANFRIIAPSVTLHAWQNGGTTVIPDPTLGIRGTIAAVKEHRVTFILFIPALLHAFVAEPEFQRGDLDVSSVEEVQIGGEIVTRDILFKAVKAFPTARICSGHGMSEGGGMFKWPFEHTPYSEIPYINDICPLGKIAQGARLRISDPQDPNIILRRGEIGELACSCNSIIRSYLDPAAHTETFFTDSSTGTRWFRTGDLAIINDQGLVSIVGRAKDRIKRSGVPILPAALENCIEKFTGSQTAILAWPHPVLGQEPLAVVREFREGIEEHVVSKFGKDYALGPVVSLEELGLERFPLNATGKVDKLVLLRVVEEYFGSLKK